MQCAYWWAMTVKFMIAKIVSAKKNWAIAQQVCLESSHNFLRQSYGITNYKNETFYNISY